MNKKGVLVLEIIWLIVGIICLFLSIHNIIKFSFASKNGYILYIMTFLSFLMYAMRRHMRKNYKSNE